MKWASSPFVFLFVGGVDKRAKSGTGEQGPETRKSD
jgi:hypothetical protein